MFIIMFMAVFMAVFITMFTLWSLLLTDLIAITEGGWSYDEIKEHEAALKQNLPDNILEWINRDFDQKFDSDIRFFVYTHTKELWNPTQKADKVLTKTVLDRFFAGSDLRDATPYNNFFLRFSDYSPFLPFRQLATAEAFDAYCNVSLLVLQVLFLFLILNSGFETHLLWCEI